MRTDTGPGLAGRRIRLAGLDFDRLTEAGTVDHIVAARQRHEGGWVATPNVDICRQAQHDPVLRRLVAAASLIVPDGMPLVWAARLRGHPFPERVAGGSLIFSLSEAAARDGRSIYLIGGAPGVPQRAGEELRPATPACGSRARIPRPVASTRTRWRSRPSGTGSPQPHQTSSTSGWASPSRSA